MVPVMLDRQPDLLHGDNVFIENEMWLSGIRFKEGVFTDVGYRF